MLTLMMLCSVIYSPSVFAAVNDSDASLVEQTEEGAEGGNVTDGSTETEVPSDEIPTDEVPADQVPADEIPADDGALEEGSGTDVPETEVPQEPADDSEVEEEPAEEDILPLALPVEPNGSYNAENYFDATGISTNGHYKAVGIFVDANGYARLIIEMPKNHTVKDILDVSINNGTPNTNPDATVHSTLTLTFPDGSKKVWTPDFSMIVIGVGPINILEGGFELDVTTDADGGWGIHDMRVDIVIKYGIVKTVDKKSAVTIGDKLEYTITVNNESDVPLFDAVVTDRVPAGIVVDSVDGQDAVYNAEGLLVLDGDLDLAINGSKAYKVQAHVASDAQAGTVRNTAIIGGDTLPEEKEAYADVTIVVKALTVTKIVSGNFGNVTKEFQFYATVEKDGNKIILNPSSDGTYQVGEDGTISFKLSHEESVALSGLPVGAVITVTEEEANANGYKTTYTFTEGGTAVDYPENGIVVAGDETNLIVTNRKDITIDTGVFLDSLPYILILAVVAVAAVVFVIRRHRKLS